MPKIHISFIKRDNGLSIWKVVVPIDHEKETIKKEELLKLIASQVTSEKLKIDAKDLSIVDGYAMQSDPSPISFAILPDRNNELEISKLTKDSFSNELFIQVKQMPPREIMDMYAGPRWIDTYSESARLPLSSMGMYSPKSKISDAKDYTQQYEFKKSF